MPYVFRKPKEEIMLFAGLWNRWESIDGFYLHTFTVITTEAISDLREIHSRMPVILSKNDLGIWLKDGCYSSLEYPDTEGLEAVPVDFKEFSHLAPRSGPPSLF